MEYEEKTGRLVIQDAIYLSRHRTRSRFLRAAVMSNVKSEVRQARDVCHEGSALNRTKKKLPPARIHGDFWFADCRRTGKTLPVFRMKLAVR